VEVGGIVSTVDVGIAVGGTRVGRGGAAVFPTAGVWLGAQAVARRKATTMDFFIASNYM
jgi:hypothetical protein